MVFPTFRSGESELLPWIKARWLRRIFSRTSTYSVMTAGLMLLFALLGAVELFENDISLFEVILSVGIVASGLLIFGWVFWLGRELPHWVGMSVIVSQAAISIYYLAFSDERQNAFAALQELPLMALYFAWFYPTRIARIGEILIIVAVGAAAAAGRFTSGNPDASPALLGPMNLITAGMFTWVCLEAGLFVRRRVRKEANTDHLTGALNRRGFISAARIELLRAERTRRPVCVALLDLDDFKEVNDRGGHAAGDDVLRMLAAQWMSLSRVTDTVGRLGGDEFAMLIPETDLDDALSMLRRIRSYANHPWSWGVVQAYPGETIEEVLSRADSAMYDDKRD